MSLWRRSLVVGVAMATTVFGSALPAQAAGPAVVCGATLKADAVLTKNLTCPKGNGVTLYRGVTLDLGGHTLTGPGAGSGTGVTLSAKGGSVLKNGTVQGWKVGVAQALAPEPAAVTTISKVKMVAAPIRIAEDQIVTITGSTLTTSPVDVSMSDLSVTGSTLTNSPVSHSLSRLSVNGTRLTKSSIQGAFSSVSVASSVVVGGEVSTGGSGAVTIDRTSMDGTGFTGSASTCAESGLDITNSTVSNYSQPLTGFWCGLEISNNTFSNNRNGAVRMLSPYLQGEVVLWAFNNTFRSSGIAIEAAGMIVQNNTFTGNTTGILVREPLSSRVFRNTLSANTSSGIRAVSEGLELADNRSFDNGGFGIYAPGAVDQGGNIAYGNTKGQCVGLACANR